MIRLERAGETLAVSQKPGAAYYVALGGACFAVPLLLVLELPQPSGELGASVLGGALLALLWRFRSRELRIDRAAGTLSLRERRPLHRVRRQQLQVSAIDAVLSG